MGSMTLSDYLRYIYLRLTLWFNETEGKEGDQTAGIEHSEYVRTAIRGLYQALEHYEDWQLEEVCEYLGSAISDAEMGARFKAEDSIRVLPGLIEAIERRDSGSSSG